GAARVRVPWTPGPQQAPRAAVRSVPSASRLADVVRGDVIADVSRLVHTAAREAARFRSPDSSAPAKRPVRRKTAGFRASAPLPLQVHNTAGAPRDRRVVASRARRRLRAAGLAAWQEIGDVIP